LHADIAFARSALDNQVRRSVSEGVGGVIVISGIFDFRVLTFPPREDRDPKF
jgi:hypothetical protein